MAFVEKSYDIEIISSSGGVLTPNAFSFQINMGKNRPASWTLEIEDPDGDYGSDVLAPRAGRTLSVIIGGDALFTSPTLIPMSRKWRRTDEGNFLSLSGTDCSKLLMVRGQTMPSQLSAIGDLKMARAIVAGICSAYGVTVSSSFTDYPLMKWMMQSTTPMEAILRLINVVFGEWCFLSGSTMSIFDQAEGPEGGDFNTSNLFVVEEALEMIQIINQVQVIRARTVKNYGENETTAAGRFEIPFSQPIYYPHYVTSGEVNGLWYRGAGTDALTYHHADGSWDYTGTGATPYVKAYASFIADPATPRHGKIEFDGISASEAAIIPGFDQTYDVTINDAASQALYGVFKNDTAITNVLIPTSAIATLHGQRYIREANRLARRITFEPLFDEIVLPCTMINLQEPIGGVTGDFYVEEMSLNCSDEEFSSSFSGVQYGA